MLRNAYDSVNVSIFSLIAYAFQRMVLVVLASIPVDHMSINS